MEKQISFERNMTGSFMKLQSEEPVNDLDEALLLKGCVAGILETEKSVRDGKAQYWYRISGQQSMDTLCSFRQPGLDFIGELVSSLGKQAEIMERYLMNPDCIILEPELIFLKKENREFSYTVYPGMGEKLTVQFRNLMEYLLTRIDHGEPEAVEAAYRLYDKTLEDNYDLQDLKGILYGTVSGRKKEAPGEITYERRDGLQKRDEAGKIHAEEKIPEKILPKTVITAGENRTERKRQERNSTEKNPMEREQPGKNRTDRNLPNRNLPDKNLPDRNLPDRNLPDRNLPDGNSPGNQEKEETGFFSMVHRLLERKKAEPFYANPESEAYIQEIRTSETLSSGSSFTTQVSDSGIYGAYHPTVCLSDYKPAPDGTLICEEPERFPNIHLQGDSMILGSGREASAVIPKDTVSHMQARLVRNEDSWYIEDLNSTNGTFVNGEALSYKEKRILKLNDVVRFADVKYRFV